jgi:hypothetical protein
MLTDSLVNKNLPDATCGSPRNSGYYVKGNYLAEWHNRTFSDGIGDRPHLAPGENTGG